MLKHKATAWHQHWPINLEATKQQVESMGGKTGIESILGTGSKFWIEFPLAHSEITKDQNLTNLNKQFDRKNAKYYT